MEDGKRQNKRSRKALVTSFLTGQITRFGAFLKTCIRLYRFGSNPRGRKRISHPSPTGWDGNGYLYAGMPPQPEDLTVTAARATERDTAAKAFPRERPAIGVRRAASRSYSALGLGLRPPTARAAAAGIWRALGSAALPLPKRGRSNYKHTQTTNSPKITTRRFPQCEAEIHTNN
jgi:hypothetical protein